MKKNVFNLKVSPHFTFNCSFTKGWIFKYLLMILVALMSKMMIMIDSISLNQQFDDLLNVYTKYLPFSRGRACFSETEVSGLFIYF